LRGVPVTIKESYSIAGLATTWGYPHLADKVATEDADTVAKLVSGEFE
jgi:amidase